MSHALSSRYWQDLSTEAFRALPPDTVALLPTAAIEQHGPHLPVSVDAVINQGLVARMLELLPEQAPILVLPTMTVGKSDEHLSFPGTLTLDATTTTDLWTKVGRSVARAGVRRMAIFNSHGGQMQLIDVVARRLRIEAGMFVTSVHWPALWDGRAELDEEEARHGIHGGLVETAMMLHLAPHLVDMDRVSNFRSWGAEIDRANEILTPEGAVGFGWMTEDLNPAGALGDASRATAQFGRVIVDAVATRLAMLMAEMQALDISRFDAAWAACAERVRAMA